MPLHINKIIVHFLDKKERATRAEIDYSSEMLTLDDFAFKLTEELHHSIDSNSSKKNASFKEDETNSFTNSLNDYLQDGTDDKFILFSKSLELLKEKVRRQSLAKGGYYLFSDYNI